MSDVGGSLAAMLGGGYVNYFSIDGRSYKVIPQVQQRFRLNPQQLLDYYIRTVGRQPGSAVDGRHGLDQDGAGIAQSLSAAQQRDDPGRRHARRRAGRRARVSAEPGGAHVAARLYDRLRRLEPAIHSGVQRLRHHVRLCADHHLPGAGRVVRKLPRPGDHPGVGADVDRRRADLRQPRLRRPVAQHLHRSRAGHADGPDQQARHPDRAVRQPFAGRRAARSARRSSRPPDPAAPDPDDDGRHGARRGAADHGERRRRRVALSDGRRHRLRPFDRYAVHAVRRSGGVSGVRGGSSHVPLAGRRPLRAAAAPERMRSAAYRGCGFYLHSHGAMDRLPAPNLESHARWKTGAPGNISNSRTNARGRRAISWRRCRCRQPRRVVDLGCGPGNSTELLVERFPQSEIVGLDSSPDMLRKARERLPKCKFVEADIATWTPEPDTDLIFGNAVMQWLPDHPAIMRRLLEAMPQGGVLAVQMPDNTREPALMLPARGRRERAVGERSGDQGRRRATICRRPRPITICSSRSARISIFGTPSTIT